MQDPAALYQAFCRRDPALDGRVFVAVRTTGVYCRPVCRVRTPLARNVLFYRSAAAAEGAGYRPCLRCRPELAPGAVVWSIQDASAILARQAARLLDEPEAKDALLKQLIADHEPAYADQWHGLEADGRQGMLRGIVAFELSIEALQCKLKLNQHRPESHAAMVQAYRSADNDGARGLADWMQRLGLVPQEGV